MKVSAKTRNTVHLSTMAGWHCSRCGVLRLWAVWRSCRSASRLHHDPPSVGLAHRFLQVPIPSPRASSRALRHTPTPKTQPSVLLNQACCILFHVPYMPVPCHPSSVSLRRHSSLGRSRAPHSPTTKTQPTSPYHVPLCFQSSCLAIHCPSAGIRCTVFLGVLQRRGGNPTFSSFHYPVLSVIAR
jgi:hypothetical protein